MANVSYTHANSMPLTAITRSVAHLLAFTALTSQLLLTAMVGSS
jgi:hypothetical protein